MTSPGPPEWPDDPDALARLAADQQQTLEVRQGAFGRLVPIIHRVVRRLAVRFSGQLREDLCANAPGDVWPVISQFSSGAFEPWCFAVLRNRYLDLIRQEQRRQQHTAEAGLGRPAAIDLRGALERASDLADPFTDGDLDVIDSWPPRHRLVLLCLSRLHTKVPPERWQRWVEEHRQLFGVPGPGRFPPDALQHCDTIADCNALLARSLNLGRNTLSACLHRGKEQLLNLRYVRGLLEHPPDGPRP